MTDRTSALEALDRCLRNGLIVSCQPVDNGPMDDDDTVVRLARAAVAGGADGLRIEGASRVARVRQALPEALIIGIVKRDLPDSPVRITPFLSDVEALALAGADIIAVDGTDRPRPESLKALIEAIHHHGKVVMADCSCLADAGQAHRHGADIVGSTLSGYTGGPVPAEPDYDLLQQLAQTYPRVMAEGRFNTPGDCTRARQLGAWAVTVGTAITRTEVVTQWFVEATSAPRRASETAIATER
ncbi:N-acetylmannosamine-6-phosphate 2-epimerase [Microbulbifer flavimaris]|uniref:Putative N-acetylmannosamine-6-phosphate 2-epimerase n=1 Tax=Microbulbifer flavimaris TaxID=1781068 RepID=A0ABX4HYG4_9GAMM|nr:MULTISPECIES: putative N-acetylmannosamine-6-phosphate 2-epimerase [Microbulbifer]KUJ82983.1 N-acetylmannosamine-6-phosphate 2-epimerase [Microbulbifer sp. ZGT114]PCO05167.1 N-acetylmannosamine-6-phosphate 2-epimerase [Microbulbifer flavimaris]